MTGVINVGVLLPAVIFPVVIGPSGGPTPPVSLLPVGRLHQTFPSLSIFILPALVSCTSPILIIFLIIIFTGLLPPALHLSGMETY